MIFLQMAGHSAPDELQITATVFPGTTSNIMTLMKAKKLCLTDFNKDKTQPFKVLESDGDWKQNTDVTDTRCEPYRVGYHVVPKMLGIFHLKINGNLPK